MTRQMTPALEQAINSITETEWRAIAKMLTELSADAHGGAGSLLRRVLLGMYAEHRQDLKTETTVLAELEADHQRWLDELAANAEWHTPPQQPRTQTLNFDPDTGESHIEDTGIA